MEGNSASDYARFDKMITPVIIQIVFWVGAAGCIVMGIGEILAGSSEYSPMGKMPVLFGLATLVLGPIYVRVVCELVMVIFSINTSLQKINEKTPASRLPLP